MARNFLHSFPLSGTPVVQSYWAWRKYQEKVPKTGIFGNIFFWGVFFRHIFGAFWGQFWESRISGRGVSFSVFWAAANGGVTNGGLRGVWPPFPEIGKNWPFSPFFYLFRPFPEGTKSTWEIQKTEEKGLFPQISSDLLKPPSLKPPFAALQVFFCGEIRAISGSVACSTLGCEKSAQSFLA